MSDEFKSSIQAVERALRLVELLADNGMGRRLADLSEESGLAPSTTHRALQTLTKVGYVCQDNGSGLYRLTGKLLEVASRGVGGRLLRREALPHLERLKGLTRESLHLVVREDRRVLTVEAVLSEERNLVACKVGETAPLHCTAVGKVLMAFIPEEELHGFILSLEMPRLTDNTICTVSGLESELARVREQGYAVDWEENEIGVRCIAAPVRDISGNVVAAVGISGPTTRVTDAKRAELAGHIVAIAGDISRSIGYSD